MDWNQEAFAELILRYVDALYSFARMLTGSADGAEDLVQETCLRAIRCWKQYEPGTHCKAWLFTIMRNQFLNDRRARGRELLSSGSEFNHDEENGGMIVRMPAPLQRPDLKIDLEKALASLPEGLRMIVLLRDQEGLEYREIADLLDCPIGTVMSRLSRGRFRVKRFLTGEAH